MYIGEASKASGASIKAIRLYEQLGLLRNVQRINSYRVYTQDDVLLIKLIKLAQQLDFKLSEMKAIIYPEGEDVSWEKIKQEIDRKQESLSREILRLQENKVRLQKYSCEIAECLLENETCQFPPIR